MPELPEVETTKRDMGKWIINDTFTGEGFCDWKKMLDRQAEKFFAELKNAKVKSLDRRAKILAINLTSGFSLVSHFKMTGHYLLVDDDPKFIPYANIRPSKLNLAEPLMQIKQGRKKTIEEAFKFYRKTYDPFIHVLFRLKHSDLLYTDIRKFGWFKIVKTSDFANLPEIKELGPEPLSKDFTFEYLREKFAKTNRKVKQVLMDQTVVAGIGNIYADEILWAAKVHPEAPANKLSVWQIQAIFDAIRPELEKGIKNVGSSIGEYRRIDNSLGKTQNFFNAYGREGKPCRRCGSILKKVVIGQRSAVFCPQEQKL